MIKYNPDRWIKLIFHRYSRKTFRKTLPNMLSIAFWSLGFSFLYDHYWKSYYEISPVVHSLLGIVLGLFLVFRTNTAYDKWWEGRTIWGALVNDCRNLAMKFNAFISKDRSDDRKYLAEHIASYTIAMKDHLRDERKLDALSIDEEEKKQAEKVDHIPNYIASNIYSKVQALYAEGILSGDQLFLVDKEIKGLTDNIGKCERIKNTPIPYSYSMYIKKFIFIYGVTLPLGLVSTFHWWTVAVVMLVFYFLVTVELIAEEIEEPFGLDDNDLPTDELAEMIGQNVREIFKL